MSIYGNNGGRKTPGQQLKALKESKKTSVKTSNKTKSADTKNIRNDKDLTAIVKEFDKSIGGVKEILYDHKKVEIGLLLRSGEPYFFTEKQSKLFSKHLKGV